MPSNRERREYEEESNTTLRHQAHQLVKAKWSTKLKIWVSTVAGGVPLLVGIFAGVQWINQNVAWAADVAQSQNVQFIQNQMDRTDDRLWKVRHDLEQIQERFTMGNVLFTDALDKETLLAEYIHLIKQKSTWAAKEKEATK